MDDLRGKTAVVTGAGSGIGRGIALALAGEGVNVVIADVREPNANAVAEEARATGLRALAVRTDVRHGRDLDELAEAAFGEFGRVELLVQVAGVVHAEPPEDTSEDDWRWVFEVNTFGIANGCRSVVPRMIDQGGECHIVNTSSLAGLVRLRLPHYGLYTASKYAATGFTEILRAELAPQRIGVSLLIPGRVRSNLVATSAEIRPPEYGGALPTPGEDGQEAASLSRVHGARRRRRGRHLGAARRRRARGGGHPPELGVHRHEPAVHASPRRAPDEPDAGRHGEGRAVPGRGTAPAPPGRSLARTWRRLPHSESTGVRRAAAERQQRVIDRFAAGHAGPARGGSGVGRSLCVKRLRQCRRSHPSRSSRGNAPRDLRST